MLHVVELFYVSSCLHEPLAQLVEHLTFNQGVVGSNRTWLILYKARRDRFAAARLVFLYTTGDWQEN